MLIKKCAHSFGVSCHRRRHEHHAEGDDDFHDQGLHCGVAGGRHPEIGDRVQHLAEDEGGDHGAGDLSSHVEWHLYTHMRIKVNQLVEFEQW